MDRVDVLAGIIVIVFLLVLFSLLIGGVYWVNSYGCTSRWPTEFHPQFGLWTHCTIEVNNVRIPAENYRVL